VAKKNNPPGYPGDEAIKKAFGEALRELRLQKGLSEGEADALLQGASQQNLYPRLYRALGVVVRQLREKQKMSRGELSSASGLQKRFITALERGRVKTATLTQIVRLAMSFEYSVADFVEEVLKKEQELTSE
jgi:transcriptional regulator with XRE-family HTH domain